MSLWENCHKQGGTETPRLGGPRSPVPPKELGGKEVDGPVYIFTGLMESLRPERGQAGLMAPLAGQVPLMGLSFPICLVGLLFYRQR